MNSDEFTDFSVIEKYSENILKTLVENCGVVFIGERDIQLTKKAIKQSLCEFALASALDSSIAPKASNYLHLNET